MESIELLVAEHKKIKRVLTVARKLALKILDEGSVDAEAFYQIVDFARSYADKHHHSKEEDILFKEMSAISAELAEGPISAMLNEHGLGRMFIHKLKLAVDDYLEGSKEARLDIIANAVAYADLLNGHIDKEDHAIYVYAENNLPPEIVNTIKEKINEVEKVAADTGIQDRYLAVINELEAKV